jgi:hypothetical protein
MPAKAVYSDKNEKPDGSRYEMVAWQVPASEDFPKGLKYSFQYMMPTVHTATVRRLASPPRYQSTSSTHSR